MTSTAEEKTPGSVPFRSRGKALLLTLPVMPLTFVLLMGGPTMPRSPIKLAAVLVTYVLINVLFYLMVRTGRTDRYRAVLFVTMAVTFVIGFIANLIEMRGSMALTTSDMAAGETPFCHMVIPMTIIPAALTKTIIFPGHMLGGFAPVAAMFALWIGVSLAIGRGFCSWGCFFGGLEDGFSRILRRPVIRKIAPYWMYLPYTVLAAVVILSAATLSPTYCEWLCPFKTVTEYNEITSTRTAIQAVIFVSLFAGLVVVLPTLTKKRTQCGLFCPMGAFQSVTNKIDAFTIQIDRTRCTDCQRCVQTCPTFSLDEESLAAGKPKITCCKCGKCIDACTKGAIGYRIKGTASPPERARLLFLYPAFIFLATIGGGMIIDGLHRILLLVTTGRMIQ
ncbi:MAG: 4Fe-4S binding protein [Acidobacteria bacterium]|nr:4Fe-4S binding protein [Acidobacteriota bacterium]